MAWLTQQFTATDPLSVMFIVSPVVPPDRYHENIDEGMDAPLPDRLAEYLVAGGAGHRARFIADPAVVPANLAEVTTVKVAMTHYGATLVYPPGCTVRLYLGSGATPFAEADYNFDTGGTVAEGQIEFPVSLTRAEYVELQVEFQYITKGDGLPGLDYYQIPSG